MIIRTELITRTLLTNNLNAAGKAMGMEKPAKPATGELSGMGGVEKLLEMFSELTKIYNKMGKVAIADAENMQAIAREFSRLDSSAD